MRNNYFTTYSEIDKNSDIVNDICNLSGKTIGNCTAVLQSKASKVFGISWSEVGFFYFSSTTLLLLMPSLPFMNKLFLLALGNVMTLPYIPFSIFFINGKL